MWLTHIRDTFIEHMIHALFPQTLPYLLPMAEDAQLVKNQPFHLPFM